MSCFNVSHDIQCRLRNTGTGNFHRIAWDIKFSFNRANKEKSFRQIFNYELETRSLFIKEKVSRENVLEKEDGTIQATNRTSGFIKDRNTFEVEMRNIREQ